MIFTKIFIFLSLLTSIGAVNFIVESKQIIKNRNKIAEYSGKHIYLINQYDNILKQFNQTFQDSNDFNTDNTQYLNTSYLWNLDIIDGEKNTEYNYDYTGKNIPIYVVDSGISPLPNFENRIEKGISMIGQSTTDCMGHGTIVSSIIASKEYGVSKDVIIIPVRIFGCSGSATTSTVIRALDWIRQQPKGIINMSISGSYSYFIDQMIKELYKNGFVVVTSAGNNGDNACFYSPASTIEAITVGSYNYDFSISEFSNEGNCVDIFAPGNLIIGEYLNGKLISSSGTSFATPHVSAICAQILEKYPYYTQEQVVDYLMNSAKTNLYKFKSIESPNKMAIVPDVTKCTELKLNQCNIRDDCTWFNHHGCRINNFCGFRLKKKCQNYRRCKWTNNKCTQNN